MNRTSPSWPSVKDDAGVAWTLNYQGDVAREKADFAAALAINSRDRGDFRVASLLFERCIAIWRELGDSARLPVPSAISPV